MKKLIILFLIIISFAQCNFGNNTKPKNETPEAIVKLNNQIAEKPMDAGLYYERGLVYQKMKSDSMAFIDFKKAISIDSTNSKYYSAGGDVLFENKNIGESIKYIEKAIALNPNDVKAHLKIAKLFLYIKEYPKAFASLNTVLRNDVYNSEAYFLKGLCYKDLKDTFKAESSFQTAAQMSPDAPDAYMQLGFIYESRDEKKAKQYFESAFKTDTTNLEPLNAIGMMYQNNKKNALAKEAFMNCMIHNKNYEKSYYNIGCILMDEDSMEKAARQFDIAIKCKPDYVEAYFNRGLCKENLKDFVAAKENYNTALNFDENYELAKEGLKRIK
jgi:tetratricopeptide (TPR) repeat protein